MKAIKKTTCLVLVLMMVCMTTTAFAATRYSDPVGLGTVLPRATATPTPTEEPLPTEAPVEEEEEAPVYTDHFQRDVDGNLVLDGNGDPIMLILDGEALPTGFERDASGNLILDANGDPIPTYAPVETPAPEVTVEPTPVATVEPKPVETADPVVTDEPIEETQPVERIAYTYQRDESGNLILDENGDPLVIVPDGCEVPVTWQRDESGNLVLDENGDPIPKDTIPADAEKIDSVIDALNPDRYIDIYAAWEGDTLYFGETATLIAVLYGYDNAVYTLQWQTSPDDVNWTDLENGNESRYTLTVTEDNYDNYWRIQVLISDVL